MGQLQDFRAAVELLSEAGEPATALSVAELMQVPVNRLLEAYRPIYSDIDRFRILYDDHAGDYTIELVDAWDTKP